MFDEKTGDVIIDGKKWVETIAYTISPRNKKITHDDLKRRVAAFFNKASVIFDVHISRACYSGSESVGNRPHVHGSIYQLRSEDRVSVQRWRTFASMSDLCLKDNIKEAFKSVYCSEGWKDYTKSGHEVVATWISCPRTKGCRYNKKYSGMKSCRHRFKSIYK